MPIWLSAVSGRRSAVGDRRHMWNSVMLTYLLYLLIYLFTYLLIYLFTYSKSEKLIFWPKMTKCQTILHRKNFFHHFFDLFSTQNRSIQKNKKFEKKIFFSKIWPKFTFFHPFWVQNWARFGQNDLKIFFSIFSRPEHEKWWVIW